MDISFFLSAPGLLLCALGFCAGLVDGVVGGGGLIQLPALFALLPHLPPATLLGTNKLAMVCGTAYAAHSFSRRVPIQWSLVAPPTLLAFLLAFAGAASASFVPPPVMRPVVVVLVAVMALYTLFKPKLGHHSEAPPGVGAKAPWLPLLLVGAIGFYDGIFGPGTGSFLMFVFVRFFFMNFVAASAHSKCVNLATNIASLIYFIPSGQIAYGPTAVLALCNVAGAYVGTHLALKKGTGFVRLLFLFLCLGLVGKLGYEILKDIF